MAGAKRKNPFRKAPTSGSKSITIKIAEDGTINVKQGWGRTKVFKKTPPETSIIISTGEKIFYVGMLSEDELPEELLSEETTGGPFKGKSGIQIVAIKPTKPWPDPKPK